MISAERAAVARVLERHGGLVAQRLGRRSWCCSVFRWRARTRRSER